MPSISAPYSAIVGLGSSALSRGNIGTTRDLAIDAVIAAVEDCGLDLPSLDGLLVCRAPSAPSSELPMRLRQDLGLGDLRLLGDLQIEGASVVGAIQHASLYLSRGLANVVACVFSAVPLRPGRETGTSAYRTAMPLTGIDSWEEQYGLLGAVGSYALAARRYLHQYGLASELLGGHAIACRKWAAGNPAAMLREPLSLAEYTASRAIVDPLRLLDCAYAVNGATAVVLTRSERADDFRKPPVYVHAIAQGHSGARNVRGSEVELNTGGRIAARSLWKQSGIGPADVQMAQVYDAFSWLALEALESYGLCAAGTAAHEVFDGATSPGGRLPVNTGGGHLSASYLQGMTPVAEAVIQARGEGGARQAAKNEVILVTGNGGRSEFHAALLVSPMASF